MARDLVISFDLDFGYSILVFIWIFASVLAVSRQWRALVLGFVGAAACGVSEGVYGYVVYGWVEVRGITQGASLVFFVSAIAGFIATSWLVLLFDQRTNRVGWTAFAAIGWLLAGSLSNLLPVQDAAITVTRHMQGVRWPLFAGLVLGYAALRSLGYTWNRVATVYGCGFLVQCGLFCGLVVNGMLFAGIGDVIGDSLLAGPALASWLYIGCDWARRATELRQQIEDDESWELVGTARTV